MRKIRLRFYVLEFVLIFSAVFFGFLADNIRENFSDQAREETYIKSLVHNLVSDTLQLQTAIAENTRKADHLDSALLYKNISPSDTATTFKFLWYTTGALTRVHFFKNNEATLQQLKNGGFSILPQQVMDSIADYDTKLSAIYREEIQYTHNNWRTYEISQEVINYADLTPKNAYRYISFSDKAKLQLLQSTIWDLGYSVKGYLELLKAQQAEARNLINFLKDQYDLV